MAAYTQFIQLLAASPVPYPPPTWENLIPWIIGFCGTALSTVIWYILVQQNKQLHEIRMELGKMANAINLSNRVRLIQMMSDPNLHQVIKDQCAQIVREIDDATGNERSSYPNR